MICWLQDINKIKNDKTKKKSQSVPTTPKKPLQKNRQEEEVEDEVIVYTLWKSFHI